VPWRRRREEIWKSYNEAFADLPVTLPAKPEPDTRHAYHVYQEKFGWQLEDYPNAMRICRQTVSLPLSAKLTDAEVSRVIRIVQSTLSVRSKGRRTNGPSLRAGSKKPTFALRT
jgi:dTDP-4-amino-4,6-dideoxygalactose transaminase